MQLTVAVAWMRKEDWPAWQSIDADLPAYDNWLRKIELLVKEIEKRGQIPEKVTVDPDEFVMWCRANGRQVERNARAQFAAELLTRKRRNH